MPDRPEFFGLSAPPITAAVVGALAGWVRDSGTATTRLFAAADQVSIGTATAVTGRKLTILTTGANQGIRISATAATDNVIDALNGADAFPRLSIDASGAVVWGGGAGAGDLRAQRSAAGVLALDNGAGGDATLTVRKLGTTALRADTVTRGANRAGRLVVAAGADALLATDDNVGYNATAGNQTPTLPDLATNRGMTVTVLRVPGDVSANTCIVTPTGADTVWGAATRPMLAGTSATFYAAPSGTEWWIL